MTSVLQGRCVGATLHEEGCTFRVWAPGVEGLTLRLLDSPDRLVPMEREDGGYWRADVKGVDEGARYAYRLGDGRELPDPASRCQPDGVHGPSAVVSSAFSWRDEAWNGLSLEHYVIYELHVGTFTREGTFEAVIPHLEALRELGVTAMEIMPIAEFPGGRNWGYDGVYPYAAQSTYGGPTGFKRLVDAAHAHGMAVVLDVVYNHLGPEGNYLGAYGPYFTDRYRTPWGQALNFDGPLSDEVRQFFIESAMMWTNEFHVDALRLDAVHAIVDNSPVPFLEELAAAVRENASQSGRHVYVIAESAANDARILHPRERNGQGMDAQWNDDFHHALHVVLTGEQSGYYQDYVGGPDLARALKEGYVYAGRRSAYRQRRHGRPATGVPAFRFVVFAQNHDQVGNRMMGERLSALVSFERLKLAAAMTLLSPFVPLLFMGEEYGETAPFLYFVSHSDPNLVEAVRRGRADEFAAFAWRTQPPDPQAEETFNRSRLDQSLRTRGRHAALQSFYRELLRLRREVPSLAHLDRERLDVLGQPQDQDTIGFRRWHEESEALALFNFAGRPVSVSLPALRGPWVKDLDSSAARWGGRGEGPLAPDALDLDKAGTVDLAATTAVLYTKRAG